MEIGDFQIIVFSKHFWGFQPRSSRPCIQLWEVDLERLHSTALRRDLTREPGRGRIPQATELFGSAAGNETGENRVC